jgi:hypothetical protein
MAESYVRTALELRELGDLAFFGRFGGETARVLTCFAARCRRQHSRAKAAVDNDVAALVQETNGAIEWI